MNLPRQECKTCKKEYGPKSTQNKHNHNFKHLKSALCERALTLFLTF